MADPERHVHRQVDVMLTSFGHRTHSVFDGVRAQAIVSSDHHDVLLLATVLGNGPDGFGLCRQLRAAGDRIPIILLGNGGDEADIVAGLEAGADDFMAKPVRLAELRSRIAALLRRQRYVRRIPPLRLGHVVLDHSARVVTCDAQPVPLTYTEYELLFLLICQRDRVLSREELLRAARGDATFTDPRSIDVYIRHLRLKLERDPSLPMLIQTVRGVGYKATQPSAATAHAGLAPTAGAAGFDKR